jgi:hypothetical protein
MKYLIRAKLAKKQAFEPRFPGHDFSHMLVKPTHSPDDIQIGKYRTAVPPPRELHPFRSHPMA